MVDYALNELMRPIYDAVQEALASPSLWPDLREIESAGLTRTAGRIYLRHYARKRGNQADGMDQWAAERWVNDIHIESSRPPSDPAWRADVLTQALLFVSCTLPSFAALAKQPVQAVIGLQSAPGNADPGSDYPVGSIHLYQLARSEDDARNAIEAFHQPVLVVTSGGT